MFVWVKNNKYLNSIKHNCMKSFLSSLLAIILFSCSSNHYHDGKYTLSTMIYNVTVEINGDDVNVKNSAAGESHFTCTQYPDRIEYREENGTDRVLRVNENGDMVLSDGMVFTKVN